MDQVTDESSLETFYMLGIIHRDSRNETVIGKWMDRIRPDVITMELSSYGLAFRRDKGAEYSRKIDDILSTLRSEGYPCLPGDTCDLYSYVNIPREYKIADDYSRRNGCSLYMVDMDLFSSVKLQRIEDLISEENIRKMLSEEAGNRGSRERVFAGLYFGSGVTAFSYTDEMMLRDSFICRRIDILMKHFGDKRFLHVAGWRHLKDPLGLYSRFQPVKIYPYD